MKYLFSIFILSAVFIYLLTECASITPPGGGPRDTIPPVLVKSIPENKSINFKGNSVLLVYDEYLKIENLTQELIITPIISGEYEQKTRRNSIELSFSEPFQDSTTYTLNFQEAIQDITEGNVTMDNVLAFSTGNYIDSLYINGKVLDLFTNDPLDGITVCLYMSDDTLDIFNSQPVYLTKTNKEGKYLIENIKNDAYRLYAYKDANSNLICDMPKEMFGFSADTINLQDNIDSIFLKIQYLDMRPIEIQRAGASGQYYEINTNKPLLDYTVQPIDTSKEIYHNFGEDKKTIRFYNNLPQNDSIQFIFTARDSVNNILTDTLYLKFIESKRDLEEFTLAVNPKTNSKITDDFQVEIIFSKPIINFLFDSLYFEYDSLTYQFFNDSLSFTMNDQKDIFTFKIDLFFSDYLESIAASDTAETKPSVDGKEGRQKSSSGSKRNTLKFHLGKGAFTSADGDSSQTLELEYQMLRPENYGIIKGKVITEFDFHTIQLMKGKNNVYRELYDQKEYEFENVDPGNYDIRVFIDNNGNGKWDPGNIFKNVEPEGVYFFRGDITIRSNWELTDIDLSF
jgi:uncharacterized protein (DUF2141 family)